MYISNDIFIEICLNYMEIDMFATLRCLSNLSQIKTWIFHKMIAKKINQRLSLPISDGSCCVADCNRNRLITMSIFPSVYERKMIQLYCSSCIQLYPRRILIYKNKID